MLPVHVGVDVWVKIRIIRKNIVSQVIGPGIEVATGKPDECSKESEYSRDYGNSKYRCDLTCISVNGDGKQRADKQREIHYGIKTVRQQFQYSGLHVSIIFVRKELIVSPSLFYCLLNKRACSRIFFISLNTSFLALSPSIT